MANTIRIRASELKKLVPPEANFIRYWDDQVKGFGVRHYATGTMVFLFRYYNQAGREKQYTIGKNLVPDQARKKAQELQGKVAMGKDPLADRELERVKSATFGDLCQRYISEEMPKLKKRTQTDYGRHLKNMSEKFGKIEARHLREEDFRREFEKCRTEKGDRTANVLMTVLKRLFNLAVGTWKICDQNPCDKIKKMKEVPRTQRLTQGQIRKLEESIEEELNPYIRAFFKVLIRTACRLGELQNMKWKDINFETSEWKKPETKIGEPHIIPLSDSCLSLLCSLERKPDNEYVFCGMKRGQPLNSFQKFWVRILKRAGFEDVHAHDLRRTVGYLLLKAGVPIERVSQILGHKSIRTTERYYAGLDIEVKRSTFEKLDSLL